MHPFEINYIAFAVFLLLYLIIQSIFKKTDSLQYIFIGIAFFVFVILHVGVDINSVEDLPRYEEQFYNVSIVSFDKIYDQIRTTDYFYAIINRFVSYFSKDFQFFLLVYNLILFGSIFHVIKRYSPIIPVSIVFLLLSIYNQSLIVLRQYLALSLILLSIPSILNKKLVPYLLLSILAFFTHSSAIMWFPIYFIYHIKTKKNLFVCGLLAISMLAFINTDLGRYLLIFGLDYSSYLDNSIEMSLSAKLIRVIYLSLYLLFVGKHALDDGIIKLCTICTVLLTAGYLFAPPIEIIGRMLLYYSIFLMLVIPITMSYMKNPVLKLFYVLGILILQGYLTIKGLEEDFFAYYSYEGIPLLYTLIIFVCAFITMVYHGKPRNVRQFIKAK